MSKMKKLLLIISLSLFGLSLILLIGAMVLHAIFGDGFFGAAIAAMIAVALAFGGIVSTCFYGKKEPEEKQL